MHAIDLHQHLWPATFTELLRRRTRAPYLRGWQLVTDGEPPYEIHPGDHDVDRRVDQDRRAGIGLACVSLSSPLGIESLPRDEAGALIEAWHAGVRRPARALRGVGLGAGGGARPDRVDRPARRDVRRSAVYRRRG